MAFGIIVIWQSGRQTYLKNWSSGERLEFSDKTKGDDLAERIRADLVPDIARSVSVIALPHGCLSTVAIAELQRQRCKVCWNADGFDFHVQENVWAQVVPEALRNKVVCLSCFERLASECPSGRVDFHPLTLYFNGREVSFEFELVRIGFREDGRGPLPGATRKATR